MMDQEGFTASEQNNCRIPTKKRGRPRQERTRASIAKGMGLSKDDLLALSIASLSMDRDLYRECLEKIHAGQMTKTVMGYVARFRKEQQREALDKFNRMGARAAKRWFECTMNPPTEKKIVDSIGAFLWREFPTVGFEALADACFATGRLLLQFESNKYEESGNGSH